MRQLFRLSSYFLIALALGACFFTDTETATATPTPIITTTATRTPTPTLPAPTVAPTVTPTPTLQPPEPPQTILDEPPPPPVADPLAKALQMWVDYLGYDPGLHPTWEYDTRCRALGGGISCVWYAYLDVTQNIYGRVIYVDPDRTGGYDLVALLAHEIGHLLLYDHDGPGLMNPANWGPDSRAARWCGIDSRCS